jgi:hypothetical protein
MTVDGRIILKLILVKQETGLEVVDWIHLTQYRDRWWWALVNTAMELLVT